MSGNKLSAAVAPVVELLKRTQLQEATSSFRSALVSGRFADAGERLQEAGMQFVDAFGRFSDAELQVCRYLHLEELGRGAYWRRICTAAEGPEKTRADVVTLYSRVMFATNHLPGLMQIFKASGEESRSNPREGASELHVRLLDAGERASDPDRISRTIDGVEMLYSACIGISRKASIDLSLVGVSGPANEKRVTFEGDRDGVSAVVAVIESIADEIASAEDLEHCDPEELVLQLPIFEDLETLQSVKKISAEEASEIAESLREGALLVMESGVLLMAQEKPRVVAAKPTVVPLRTPDDAYQKAISSGAGQQPATHAGAEKPVVKLKTPDYNASQETSQEVDEEPSVDDMSPDEFYQHYLSEKNRIQGKAETSQAAQNVARASHDQLEAGSSKSDALADLLADLDRINRK